MSGCRGIAVDGSPGGTRFVYACHRPVVDGGVLCHMHKQQEDYQRREFERMMATASRHRGGVRVGVPGSPRAGTHCLCGVFVRDGDAHPWDIPVDAERTAMEKLFGLLAGRIR